MATYARSETEVRTNGLNVEAASEADDLTAKGFVLVPLPRRDTGAQPSPHPLVYFVGVPDRCIAAALAFAKTALRGIKADTAPDMVREMAQARGLEVSDLAGDVVYASASAKGHFPLVQAKWLLEFRFESGERLVDVRVRRGLTGP
jgi:hypothetical protein